MFLWKNFREISVALFLQRNCISLLSVGLLQSMDMYTHCIHIVDILWQPHATPFLFLKFFSCLFWSLKLFVLSSTYFTNTAVCPDPGKPLKGKRHGNNFKNGSIITFTCNSDHELIGNNTMRCEDGVWSCSVPLCKGMVLYQRFREIN